jgi:hypothetical protein
LFRTEYNSADLQKTQTYPDGNSGSGGEVVTYGYHPQMSLNTVLSNFPTTYVHHTDYDAASRATKRFFWLNADVVTRYNYNLWTTQGGRLLQLQSGLSSNVTSLQNMVYNYDAVGNVAVLAPTTIQDYKNGNPQTQTFQYDDLDRLTNAVAAGGTQGDYPSEPYTYAPATGNLAGKGGASYTYGTQEATCPTWAVLTPRTNISQIASSSSAWHR